MAIPTPGLAAATHRLLNDDLAGPVTTQALAYLADLFAAGATATGSHIGPVDDEPDACVESYVAGNVDAKSGRAVRIPDRRLRNSRRSPRTTELRLRGAVVTPAPLFPDSAVTSRC